MSAKHPIIAITGSSGAGSSSMTKAFGRIFWRERVKAAYIQGSGFHRYERKKMAQEIRKAEGEGRILSHYGPEGNHLDKLETMFFQYAATGTGQRRYYLHSREHAKSWGQEPGTLTPWENFEKNTDILFYRGLHGGAIYEDIDISQYPDLLIGMVPGVNLEWIRKISRDTTQRGYTAEEVRESIMSRMHDYVYHITPQFARTHINIQMMAAVDTSDPFSINEMPIEDECFFIIHFQRECMPVPNMKELVKLIPKSFLSRPNMIVVPGGKLVHAIETILMPLVHDLVTTSRKIRGVKKPKKRKAGLRGALMQSY
jgi:phosphoribulokinase